MLAGVRVHTVDAIVVPECRVPRMCEAEFSSDVRSTGRDSKACSVRLFRCNSYDEGSCAPARLWLAVRSLLHGCSSLTSPSRRPGQRTLRNEESSTSVP